MTHELPTPTGTPIPDFIALMEFLIPRCEWKASQTPESLAPYLIEEAFEVVEAIEAKDDEGTMEELGDLFGQIVFQLLLAEHAGKFTLNDSVKSIHEKMIRRSPHVFTTDTLTPQEIQDQWDAIKATEKPERGTASDGVPVNLPALSRATKLLQRWEKAGIDPQIETGGANWGDELLALTNKIRLLGLDPEQELRRALQAREG